MRRRQMRRCESPIGRTTFVRFPLAFGKMHVHPFESIESRVAQLKRYWHAPLESEYGTAIRVSEPIRSNSVRNSSTLSSRHCGGPRR